MPRPRVVEVPQRPSSTGPTPGGLRPLRTSSSDSDPVLRRPLTERSPRLLGRQTPKSTLSGPLNQKKLGTRITDLETQLQLAQHELKNLKHQLSSTGGEKKQAHKIVRREKTPSVMKIQCGNSRDSPDNEVSEGVQTESDVSEVPEEKMLMESNQMPVKDEKETQTGKLEPSGVVKPGCSNKKVLGDEKEAQLENSELTEAEKPRSRDEVWSKNDDVQRFKAIVEEKEREKQAVLDENQNLKQQLEEAKLQVGKAQSKEEELTVKFSQLGKELEEIKVNEAKLKEKVFDVEVAKESLDNEMKKMRVQTEQWRKAADVAASVLAGGVDMNGQASDRRGSMDNNSRFKGMFDTSIDGYGGFFGSSDEGDDTGDGLGREKKRSSRIRVIGDLWKRKGQK